MKYEKIIEPIEIADDAFVSVKKMGNVTEVTYNTNRNSQPQTIKLSDNKYVILKTGEVKEYEKKAENRSQSPESIRRTMRRIKELIQTNVTDNRKAKFITLTYSDNMTDAEQLYQDFRKFNQRFQRYLKNNNWGKAEYISVVEPQDRGAWHAHVIYIFDRIAPFIPNADIERLWGHGFTKTKKIDDITNIGAYLVSYLTDMEIPPEATPLFNDKEIKEVTINGKKKSFVKGARLYKYHSCMNIVRHSKGIKYPKTELMPLSEAIQIISGMTCTYHTAYKLSNDDGYETIIDKREYQNK